MRNRDTFFFKGKESNFVLAEQLLFQNGKEEDKGQTKSIYKFGKWKGERERSLCSQAG